MKLNQLLKLGGIVLLLSTLLGCGRLWSGGKISLPGREDLFRMTIEQQLHQKYGDPQRNLQGNGEQRPV